MSTKKQSKYSAFIQSRLRGDEFDREMRSKKREVFIYARVSTSDQAKKYSIPTQFNDMKAFAKDKGFNVKKDNIIKEDETSTESGIRGRFDKMKARLQDGGYYTLLCTVVDRLHRNFTDAEELEKLVMSGHLVIWFVWESKEKPYDWTAQSHDRIIKYFKTLMSKFFVDDQTEKAIAGTIIKLEAGGFPGYPPVGYLVVNGKVVKDQERFELVKQLFNSAMSGKHDYPTITDKMRKKGLTVRVQRRELRDIKEPNLVTKTNIEAIIKNPFYTGHFKWHGQLWDNRGIDGKGEPSYERMLTLEKWEEANRMMSKGGNGGRGKSSKSHEWFYKNLLECDFCECSLGGYKTKGKYVYYQCSSGKRSVDLDWYKKHFPEFYKDWQNKTKGKKRKGKHCPCPQPIWKEEEIDETIKHAVEELYFDQDIFAWMREKVGEDVRERRDAINSDLHSLRTRKGILEHQLEDLILSKGQYEDEIELKVYDKKKAELAEETEALSQEIAEKEADKLKNMEEAIDSLELAYSFKNKYINSDREKQKIMSKMMFRTILAGSETHMKRTKPGESVMIIPSMKNGKPNYNKVLGLVWREPFRTLFDIQFLEDIKEAEEKKTQNVKWHARTDSNCRPSDS